MGKFNRDKRILITAGPTWVPIDNVRVISNISSGQTALSIAKAAQREGYTVTLALGAVDTKNIPAGIEVKSFRYFDELFSLLEKEISSKKYGVLIHCAAVSDYRLQRLFKNKIGSKRRNLKLTLIPTVKIANYIKTWDKKIFLVLFKLENEISDAVLIKQAQNTLAGAKGDLIAANKIYPRYKAIILDREKAYARANDKKTLAEKLIKVISKKQILWN